MTISRLFLVGGALISAVAFSYCGSSTNNSTDAGADMTVTPPDLTPLAPMLTAVSPSNAINTGGTVVTLTGANFQQGATVTIAGVPATGVTVVSSTQITCTVPAKAVTCGLANIQVVNPNNMMVARADLFTYRPSALAFAAVSSLPMSTTTRQVIAVDLNGDQKLDLVTANSGNGSVSTRLGNGDGTFAAPGSVTIGVGTSPYAIAAADVNGDKKVDLITANNAGSSITVRLGVGDGTFTTPAKDTFNAGAGPRDLAIGDLNGDGKLDVVVVNNGSSNVSILLGVGDGTFLAQTTSMTGTQPVAILLADFNGDGKLDFASADNNGNSATVRLGNGTGGFGAMASTVVGVTGPTGLAAADFTGDQKLDLAIANGGVGTARLSAGVGDGTFTNGATPTVGTTAASVRAIASGDFNLDGKLDLAVTNVADSNVSILLGNGDGTFQAKKDFPVGTTPGHISIADLNKDGLPDLITTDQGNNAVVVRLNQCQ